MSSVCIWQSFGPADGLQAYGRYMVGEELWGCGCIDSNGDKVCLSPCGLS